METKLCALCNSPFAAYRKALKFCSLACAAKVNVKKNHQCLPSVAHTVEMFDEADRLTPQGESRAKYIADKFGGTIYTVQRSRQRLKYKWIRRQSRQIDRKSAWFFRKFVNAVGCCICAEPRVTEACHEIAVSKGGKDVLENILPLCPTHHDLHDCGELSPQEVETLESFKKSALVQLREAFTRARSINFGKPKKGRKRTVSERKWNQQQRAATLGYLASLLPPTNSMDHLWIENTAANIKAETAQLSWAA